MFTITVGDYAVSIHQGSLPEIYSDYKRHAQVHDEFGLWPPMGEEICFISVSAMQHWPTLVVALRYEMPEEGFDPACLLVPETHTLFIGAGPRLLAYRLDSPRRLWEATAQGGFWEWAHYGDTVLMSGELELAAWDRSAQPLWKMPLEPAWEYHVDHGMVHLDVLGRRTAFGLQEGPEHAAREISK